ncbi:MAG TPA: tetratricopeptide repeat protein, partial [Chitinophagales bacterium]
SAKSAPKLNKARLDSMLKKTVAELEKSPENAIFLAQELYDEDSTEKQVIYLLAKAHSVNGDNEMSDFYNEQLLKKDSLYLPSLILKAEHLIAARNFQNANTIIGNINQKFPQSASAHYLNARYALSQNSLDAADNEATLALQTDTTILDAYIVLATSAMKQKEYTQAADYFAKGFPLVQLSSEQLNNYGVCLLESGKYKEAVAILQQANENSDNPKLAYNFGLALYQNKQYAEARKQFALENDSLSLYFIAKSFEAENELDSALLAYQQFQQTNKSISVTREIWLLKVVIFFSRNWYYILAAVVFAIILLISIFKKKEI